MRICLGCGPKTQGCNHHHCYWKGGQTKVLLMEEILQHMGYNQHIIWMVQGFFVQVFSNTSNSALGNFPIWNEKKNTRGFWCVSWILRHTHRNKPRSVGNTDFQAIQYWWSWQLNSRKMFHKNICPVTAGQWENKKRWIWECCSFTAVFRCPSTGREKKRRRLSTALLTRIASQGSKFLLPSWQGFLCHCFMWCHMMPFIRFTSPKIYGIWMALCFLLLLCAPRKSNKDQTACPLVGIGNAESMDHPKDHLGGGFKYVFYFQPYLGKINPFWRAYFSDWLVQPPTRFFVWSLDFLGVYETFHPAPTWARMDSSVRFNLVFLEVLVKQLTIFRHVDVFLFLHEWGWIFWKKKIWPHFGYIVVFFYVPS